MKMNILIRVLMLEHLNCVLSFCTRVVFVGSLSILVDEFLLVNKITLNLQQAMPNLQEMMEQAIPNKSLNHVNDFCVLSVKYV